MAIKNFVDEQQAVFICDVLAYLETNEHRTDTFEVAKDTCDELVNMLVHVQVPTNAAAIKDYKFETGKVTEVFERVVKRSGDFENLFVFCLRTLYRLIVEMNTPRPSSAAAILFNVYDEELIPKAIHLLLTQSPSNDVDRDVKKVISTLCCWLRSSSGYIHLSKCIVDLLEELRKLHKYELLLDIAKDVIEPLFIALVIPFIRPYVMPVVVHILTSIQHTPVVFHKIVPRIPKVLHAIDQTISTPQNGDAATIENLQKLVDITSALSMHFSVSDDSYYDIERALEKHSPSYGYQDVLRVNPWHSYVQVPMRDQSMPLGLVNMGNTCYMNSVLQALFMTKQFTNEILKMNSALPKFRQIQELLSLMLYSVRPYLTPYTVMNNRPPNFRHGFQQDSSEYLGYLLDQLYEEEKKFKIDLENAKNQLNNNNSSSNSSSNHNNNNNGNNGIGGINGINGINVSNGFNDVQRSPDNADSANSLSSSLDHMDSSPSTMQSMDLDTPTDESITVAAPADNISDDVILESVPPSPQMIDSREIIALPPPATHPTPSMHTPPESPPTTPAPSAQPHIVVTNTLIQKTFTGKAAITHKCMNCLSESKTADHFNELPLSFPNQTEYPDENEYTVQQLLNDYFVTEKLCDDNKYSCEKCKTLCDGERSLKIVEGPSNLILVIKHFKYDRKFHIRRKLMYKVHHNETVMLNVTNEKGEPYHYTYRLYAVIVHCGANIDSGHYYTFASDVNGNWFKFNDSHISRSSLNELMHSTKLNTPYILFYELVSKDRSHSFANGDICEDIKFSNGSVHSGNSSPISDSTELYEFDSPSSSLPTNGSNDYSTTPAFRHFEMPTMESLSPHLQSFVHTDNQQYKTEMRRTNVMGRSDFYNFHIGNRDRELF